MLVVVSCGENKQSLTSPRLLVFQRCSTWEQTLHNKAYSRVIGLPFHVSWRRRARSALFSQPAHFEKVARPPTQRPYISCEASSLQEWVESKTFMYKILGASRPHSIGSDSKATTKVYCSAAVVRKHRERGNTALQSSRYGDSSQETK